MYEIDKREYYAILRKKKKITLKEIANYIGCSTAHISRWERYINNMDTLKEQRYYEYIDNK